MPDSFPLLVLVLVLSSSNFEFAAAELYDPATQHHVAYASDASFAPLQIGNRSFSRSSIPRFFDSLARFCQEGESPVKYQEGFAYSCYLACDQGLPCLDSCIPSPDWSIVKACFQIHVPNGTTYRQEWPTTRRPCSRAESTTQQCPQALCEVVTNATNHNSFHCLPPSEGLSLALFDNATAPVAADYYRLCNTTEAMEWSCSLDERHCVMACNDSAACVFYFTTCPWAAFATSNQAPNRTHAVQRDWLPPLDYQDRTTNEVYYKTEDVCTDEESKALCHEGWDLDPLAQPCRRSFYRRRQPWVLDGSTYDYNTTECNRVMCRPVQQLLRCGHYSHRCTFQCNRDNSVCEPTGSCEDKVAFPVRWGLHREWQDSCADDITVDRRVVCQEADDLLQTTATACQAEERCGGDSHWTTVPMKPVQASRIQHFQVCGWLNNSRDLSDPYIAREDLAVIRCPFSHRYGFDDQQACQAPPAPLMDPCLPFPCLPRHAREQCGFYTHKCTMDGNHQVLACLDDALYWESAATGLRVSDNSQVFSRFYSPLPSRICNDTEWAMTNTTYRVDCRVVCDDELLTTNCVHQRWSQALHVWVLAEWPGTDLAFMWQPCTPEQLAASCAIHAGVCRYVCYNDLGNCKVEAICPYSRGLWVSDAISYRSQDIVSCEAGDPDCSALSIATYGYVKPDTAATCLKGNCRFTELSSTFHDCSYDLADTCFYKPCSMAQQRQFCGLYSLDCRVHCSGTTCRFVENSCGDLSGRPIRACTEDQLWDTCAMDVSACRQSCSDEYFTTGCVLEATCGPSQTTWTQQPTRFLRESTALQELPMTFHECSQVESLQFCGSGWLTDPYRQPCLVRDCLYTRRLGFHDCTFITEHCSCPLLFPDATYPCVSSTMTRECTDAEFLFNCGVAKDSNHQLSCEVTCTGPARNPVCNTITCQATSGGLAECPPGRAPFQSIPCLGYLTPCRPEDRAMCGADSFGCNVVRLVNEARVNSSNAFEGEYVECHTEPVQTCIPADAAVALQNELGRTSMLCKVSSPSTVAPNSGVCIPNTMKWDDGTTWRCAVNMLRQCFVSEYTAAQCNLPFSQCLYSQAAGDATGLILPETCQVNTFGTCSEQHLRAGLCYGLTGCSYAPPASHCAGKCAIQRTRSHTCADPEYVLTEYLSLRDINAPTDVNPTVTHPLDASLIFWVGDFTAVHLTRVATGEIIEALLRYPSRQCTSDEVATYCAPGEDSCLWAEPISPDPTVVLPGFVKNGLCDTSIACTTTELEQNCGFRVANVASHSCRVDYVQTNVGFTRTIDCGVPTCTETGVLPLCYEVLPPPTVINYTDPSTNETTTYVLENPSHCTYLLRTRVCGVDSTACDINVFGHPVCTCSPGFTALPSYLTPDLPLQPECAGQLRPCVYADKMRWLGSGDAGHTCTVVCEGANSTNCALHDFQCDPGAFWALNQTTGAKCSNRTEWQVHTTEPFLSQFCSGPTQTAELHITVDHATNFTVKKACVCQPGYSGARCEVGIITRACSLAERSAVPWQLPAACAANGFSFTCLRTCNLTDCINSDIGCPTAFTTGIRASVPTHQLKLLCGAAPLWGSAIYRFSRGLTHYEQTRVFSIVNDTQSGDLACHCVINGWQTALPWERPTTCGKPFYVREGTAAETLSLCGMEASGSTLRCDATSCYGIDNCRCAVPGWATNVTESALDKDTGLLRSYTRSIKCNDIYYASPCRGEERPCGPYTKSAYVLRDVERKYGRTVCQCQSDNYGPSILSPGFQCASWSRPCAAVEVATHCEPNYLGAKPIACQMWCEESTCTPRLGTCVHKSMEATRACTLQERTDTCGSAYSSCVALVWNSEPLVDSCVCDTSVSIGEIADMWPAVWTDAAKIVTGKLCVDTEYWRPCDADEVAKCGAFARHGCRMRPDFQQSVVANPSLSSTAPYVEFSTSLNRWLRTRAWGAVDEASVVPFQWHVECLCQKNLYDSVSEQVWRTSLDVPWNPANWRRDAWFDSTQPYDVLIPYNATSADIVPTYPLDGFTKETFIFQGVTHDVLRYRWNAVAYGNRTKAACDREMPWQHHFYGFCPFDVQEKRTCSGHGRCDRFDLTTWCDVAFDNVTSSLQDVSSTTPSYVQGKRLYEACVLRGNFTTAYKERNRNEWWLDYGVTVQSKRLYTKLHRRPLPKSASGKLQMGFTYHYQGGDFVTGWITGNEDYTELYNNPYARSPTTDLDGIYYDKDHILDSNEYVRPTDLYPSSRLSKIALHPNYTRFDHMRCVRYAEADVTAAVSDPPDAVPYTHERDTHPVNVVNGILDGESHDNNRGFFDVVVTRTSRIYDHWNWDVSTNPVMDNALECANIYHHVGFAGNFDGTDYFVFTDIYPGSFNLAVCIDPTDTTCSIVEPTCHNNAGVDSTRTLRCTFDFAVNLKVLVTPDINMGADGGSGSYPGFDRQHSDRRYSTTVPVTATKLGNLHMDFVKSALYATIWQTGSLDERISRLDGYGDPTFRTHVKYFSDLNPRRLFSNGLPTTGNTWISAHDTDSSDYWGRYVYVYHPINSDGKIINGHGGCCHNLLHECWLPDNTRETIEIPQFIICHATQRLMARPDGDYVRFTHKGFIVQPFPMLSCHYTGHAWWGRSAEYRCMIWRVSPFTEFTTSEIIAYRNPMFGGGRSLAQQPSTTYTDINTRIMDNKAIGPTQRLWEPLSGYNGPMHHCFIPAGETSQHSCDCTAVDDCYTPIAAVADYPAGLDFMFHLDTYHSVFYPSVKELWDGTFGNWTSQVDTSLYPLLARRRDVPELETMVANKSEVALSMLRHTACIRIQQDIQSKIAVYGSTYTPDAQDTIHPYNDPYDRPNDIRNHPSIDPWGLQTPSNAPFTRDAFMPEVCTCDRGWTGAACDTVVESVYTYTGSSNAATALPFKLSLGNSTCGTMASESTFTPCLQSQWDHDYCEHGHWDVASFSCLCDPGWSISVNKVENHEGIVVGPAYSCNTASTAACDLCTSAPGGNRCILGIDKLTGKCRCNPDYTGEDCMRRIAPRADECFLDLQGTRCNNNGKCVLDQTLNTFSCECGTDWMGYWTGTDCNVPVSFNDTYSCGAHGTLVNDIARANGMRCECEAAWTGPFCNDTRCPTDAYGNICSGRGTCRLAKDNGLSVAQVWTCQEENPVTLLPTCGGSRAYGGCACEHQLASFCKMPNRPAFCEGATDINPYNQLERDACRFSDFYNDTLLGGFACQCPATRQGTWCEQSACNHGYGCQHGVCKMTPSGPKCKCETRSLVYDGTGVSSLWYGEACEVNVFESCGAVPPESAIVYLCNLQGQCVLDAATGQYGCQCNDPTLNGNNCFESQCLANGIACEGGSCEVVTTGTSSTWQCKCPPSDFFVYNETSTNCDFDVCSLSHAAFNESLGNCSCLEEGLLFKYDCVRSRHPVTRASYNQTFLSCGNLSDVYDPNFYTPAVNNCTEPTIVVVEVVVDIVIPPIVQDDNPKEWVCPYSNQGSLCGDAYAYDQLLTRNARNGSFHPMLNTSRKFCGWGGECICEWGYEFVVDQCISVCHPTNTAQVVPKEDASNFRDVVCVCHPGFSSRTNCRSDRCINGGSWSADLQACVCPSKWEGQFCEVSRCKYGYPDVSGASCLCYGESLRRTTTLCDNAPLYFLGQSVGEFCDALDCGKSGKYDYTSESCKCDIPLTGKYCHEHECQNGGCPRVSWNDCECYGVGRGDLCVIIDPNRQIYSIDGSITCQKNYFSAVCQGWQCPCDLTYCGSFGTVRVTPRSACCDTDTCPWGGSVYLMAQFCPPADQTTTCICNAPYTLDANAAHTLCSVHPCGPHGVGDTSTQGCACEEFYSDNPTAAPNRCRLQPCMNGGLYIDNTTSAEQSCECGPGFSGVICQYNNSQLWSAQVQSSTNVTFSVQNTSALWNYAEQVSEYNGQTTVLFSVFLTQAVTTSPAFATLEEAGAQLVALFAMLTELPPSLVSLAHLDPGGSVLGPVALLEFSPIPYTPTPMSVFTLRAQAAYDALIFSLDRPALPLCQSEIGTFIVHPRTQITCATTTTTTVKSSTQVSMF